MRINMMENNKKTDESTTQDPEKKSFFKIIVHSFFIIPFLIAVFCVLLFAGMHLLTREQRTAYDYLEDVKTGGATKRWQGAFELSKVLANSRFQPSDDRLLSELIKAFENAKNDDPRVRQYLALAMGRTGRGEFVAPLIKGLKDETEANIPSLIYALGMIGDQKAVATLHEYANHADSRIRSITTVALGNIASPESKNILKNHLKDLEPNVQWGAAISLARMGDASGKAILTQMLDRKYWRDFEEVDSDERTNLMLTAISSGALLNDADLNKKIQILAKNDTNMKIRATALEVLK